MDGLNFTEPELLIINPGQIRNYLLQNEWIYVETWRNAMEIWSYNGVEILLPLDKNNPRYHIRVDALIKNVSIENNTSVRPVYSAILNCREV